MRGVQEDRPMLSSNENYELKLMMMKQSKKNLAVINFNMNAGVVSHFRPIKLLIYSQCS